MAFAAVTILMDTLHQHFLQPKPRFTLRINRRFVTSLYRNLCFLQTSLEQDSTLNSRHDEAMKDLEALIRDNCVEIRFHVEQQLRLFYLGESMKVRLQSAQKLLPILSQAIKQTDTGRFRCILDKVAKHFTLPVVRMPTHIRKRAESLCEKLEVCYLSNDEQKMSCRILIKAKSVIIQELRASYLKKYKQLQIETRQRLRQIFTMGVKLTDLIKRKQLKVKSAYNSQSKNSQEPSIGGLESENIASGVSSLQHTIKMVGCEDEFNAVMGKLKRESSRREIVSIVGTGGIGKTTLARRIYGDASKISHFDCQAWVTISQQYKPRQVKESLLHSLGSGNIETSNEASEDHLSEQIYRCLKRQRYFIVLDDIWSTDAWRDLRICFPEDNNGSRMLLTTRLKSVAEYASPGSNSYHNMRFLSLDESWNLFHNKLSEKITFSPEFEKIGREIVQKCKGLPLAISVAAGLLSNSKHTIEEWKYIAKNVSTLSLDHSDEQCADILNLSYTFLPHHLKLCFLSFIVFPKDYVVCMPDIVNIWLSEGFLKVVSSKSLEDVVRGSIQDLVDRNLVQICSENHFGRINSYQMHDVLRELALREAEKENLLCCLDYGAICMRHGRTLPINIISHKAHDQQRIIIRSTICCGHCSSHCRNFSSICWFWDDPHFRLPSSLVSANFKLLRALIINTTQLNNISVFTVIMGLVHLRCLVFKTRLNIKFLPWFMLWNLQILVIYNEITYEPLGIFRLPHIRQLHFTLRIALVPPKSIQDNLDTIGWLDYRSCTKEFFMKIPKLTTLGVCGTIIQPKWEESNWFESLVNLYKQQEQEISGKECEEYNWFENLVYLYRLEELSICGKIIGQGFKSVHSMAILSFESFLQNLTNLTLYFTGLEWKDMDVVGALPKLKSLKLTCAVDGPKWEPIDGGFLQLKYLVINSSDIMYWEATSDHFPVLEHLVLNLCMTLKGIPNGFSDIATLQSIRLCKCSDSVITSAEHIRDEQQEFGNEAFLLHIDQDIEEWYSEICDELGL